MALFDNIGKKISETGQGAVRQTKMMANVAKFKSEISDYESKMKGIYLQIGQKYYEDNKGNEQSPYWEGIQMVNGYKDHIEELQKKIQQEKGVRACPHCGAQMSVNAIFCSACGQKSEEVAVSVEPSVEESDAPVEENSQRRCANCGEVLKEGQIFCASCGTKAEQ